MKWSIIGLCQKTAFKSLSASLDSNGQEEYAEHGTDRTRRIIESYIPVQLSEFFVRGGSRRSVRSMTAAIDQDFQGKDGEIGTNAFTSKKQEISLQAASISFAK